MGRRGWILPTRGEVVCPVSLTSTTPVSTGATPGEGLRRYYVVRWYEMSRGRRGAGVVQQGSK